MKKFILDNGLKIIYEAIPGNITSFTIGLEAGANVESEEELGIAHVVEHMVFKGTSHRDEKEINELCNELFGFHNAMTNFPYVVYYGTCLTEDFKKAFEVYSDIILHPKFPEDGFEEEIKVIKEELKEWSDDLSQHCEDLLFYNSFKERRIKNLIIGTEKSLDSFSREHLKTFYNKYYKPSNTVISVVTSLTFDEVLEEIKNHFSNWREAEKEESSINSEEVLNLCEPKLPLYEEAEENTYYKNMLNINGAKIQFVFPIHQLKEEEVTLLRLFNERFGEGTNSILYEEIRTNQGLVYDINGKIKNEKGIKLYTITLATSKDNVEKAIKIIKNKIINIDDMMEMFNKEQIKKYIRSQKLKRTLALEKSIVLSMNLAVYELMYNNAEALLKEFDFTANATGEEILGVAKKVLNKLSIQIIMPE